jgi:hypothetical protein
MASAKLMGHCFRGRTMEQHQARLFGLQPAGHESLPDQALSLPDQSQYIAGESSGLSASGRSAVKASFDDSVNAGVFHTSDPIWDQLVAIRRRLWILNATLQSLPAKLELACRKRDDAARDAEPDQP